MGYPRRITKVRFPHNTFYPTHATEIDLRARERVAVAAMHAHGFAMLLENCHECELCEALRDFRGTRLGNATLRAMRRRAGIEERDQEMQAEGAA